MGIYRVCCFFSRKFKVTEAKPPSDVEKKFEKYSDDGKHMTVDHLRRFIEDCQGGNGGTISDAERIVEHVLRKRHRFKSLVRRKTLSLDDFCYYLFNSQLNPPIGSQVHHDMSAPLSHYFIYTGHNSYLTGNQLYSPSSHLPIIKALKQGVRGIELDLWPSDSKDDVYVKHGGTLTTPVELIVCLDSIKEYAFTTSPYPVIITLEDHLTPDLQAKVAQMVIETFGEMLFYPKSGELQELPSPESLKYKILISTKPPNEYHEAKVDKCSKTARRVKHLDDDDEDDSHAVESCRPISFKDNNHEYESDDDIKDRVQKYNYKSLIAIPAGKPSGGLEEALKFENKVRRLSLEEKELEIATKSHQHHIVRFTQKNIIRVYPNGLRVDSSNFKPLTGWLHGAQMIAFNMQGYDKWSWLMHGMFRGNGGCGYVKKPVFLLTNDPNGEVFDPKAKLQVKLTLKVKIYMGDGWHLDFKQTHFDTYSPPDFYTRVGISGAPADKTMSKTKKKEDTWRPVWDEEFTFKLTRPEIALLRIEVHEYDMSERDDFGGQTCLPVSELRPGIRTVPLCNWKGETYNGARLLMRFEFGS